MTIEPRRLDNLGWTVEPIGAALGVLVHGVNLADGVSTDARATLSALLDQHLVLAIPGVALSHVLQVELGRVFGEPFVHPFLTPVDGHPEILEVVKEPSDRDTFGGEFWHADITFQNPPSSVSLLQAEELPPLGGDTLFANQFLAFERLSPAMQDMLDRLEAVHLYPGMSESDEGAMAIHPVVRTHPHTQRRALYVNPAFTTRFVGMTVRESAALLGFLFEHQVQNEFVSRVSWTEGQLTIWDNRAVLHYAMNDYIGHRRQLRRVTSMEVS